MPMSDRARRVAALLACWAFVWAAFVPAIVRESLAGRGPGIDTLLRASLCSAHAPVRQGGGVAEDEAPANPGPAAHGHCPLCSGAGDHPVPLPASAPQRSNVAPLACASASSSRKRTAWRSVMMLVYSALPLTVG